MIPMVNKPLITRTPEQLATLRQYALENGLPIDIYENFTSFAHYMVPLIGEEQFEWQWFHYHICDMYNQVIFKGVKLFTIELPPQIGKSLLTSLFIVYCFGINPDLSIMYVTYNEKKATDFTKKYVIHQLGTAKYAKIFPFVVTKNMLDKKDNSKTGSFQKKTATFSDTEFTLSCPIASMQKNYRGGYKCFGMEQGIHGSPANIFLVDDYVDKGDSVRSENFRRQRQEWFYNDMASRLQGNNSVVGAICTRWYHLDIIGLLHQSYTVDICPAFLEYDLTPPNLEKVKIRFEYRETDNNPPCDPRTKTGQILWLEHLLKYSIAKKGIYANAMYNCDPSDTDSVMQLRPSDFAYYDKLPDVAGRYMFSIDGASTTNKRSDHTAIGYWFVSGLRRYLVKLWYVKMENPVLLRFVKDLLDTHEYDECLIEFASAGVPLSQSLKDEKYPNITQLGFSGRPIQSTAKVKNEDKIGKGNSKLERYLRCLPEFLNQDKRIFIPKFKIDHLDTFITQLTTFDGSDGRADDMVDMATYLVYYTKKNVVLYNPRRENLQPVAPVNTRFGYGFGAKMSRFRL